MFTRTLTTRVLAAVIFSSFTLGACTSVYDRAGEEMSLDMRSRLAQRLREARDSAVEAANIIKKIGRGDFTLESARPALAKEFADVLTYLDILAFRCGVDLGAATLQKFNEISARVGSPIKIDPNEKWPYDERIVDEKPEANIERRSWCPAWEANP